MTFDDLRYTEDSIIKQLGLIELHGKDGSAVEAGCKCIETKHLFLLEGLGEEGVGFALSEEQKRAFEAIADWARETRKKLETEDYKSVGVCGNPRTRAFLPHGLTEKEAASPSLRRSLSSCIKQAEKHCCGKFTSDYSQCSCNPVAVCRASLG